MNHRYRAWLDTLRDVAALEKLFIVGCARSGTTWLATLLDAHPSMVVKGEGALAWQLFPRLQRAIGEFNAVQQRNGKLELNRLGAAEVEPLLRSVIDGQFGRYLRSEGRSAGEVQVVGDKTPQHSIRMDLLAHLTPEARFLHVIRDPRDAATSAWFRFGRPQGKRLDDYVSHFLREVWPLNVGSARKSGAALGPRYSEVRYEDLLVDPAQALTGALEFLGVDSSDGVVSSCLEAGSFRKKAGREAGAPGGEGAFYRKGVAGDWRNHLPEDLVRRCCGQIEELMRSCGYDPAVNAAR